jgi:photosystem II stability/assembly factor-like uncharacterized protein
MLSALVSIPVCVTTHAQGLPGGWQPLGGPPGRISHLAVNYDGTDLYAVSVAETRRGDDQTQRLEAGRPTRSDALYRSQDGGARWQPLTNDLEPGPISALYADPDGRTLYAGLRGELWISPDRGSSWSHIRLAEGLAVIQRITRSADGQRLFAGVSGAEPASGGSVHRSDDNGRTWTASDVSTADPPPGTTLADVIPHPQDSRLLFVTTNQSQLQRSGDAGETWTPVSVGDHAAPEAALAAPARLAISPDRPDTLLLVRSFAGERPDRLAVDRSPDRGATWGRLAATGLPSSAEPRTLVALPGGVFLLNTDAGTFRSADSGSTWQPLEGALSSSGVAQFLPWPQAGAAPTTSTTQTVLAATGYGIFVSRDRGALWQAHGTGLPANSRIAGLLTDARRPGQIWAISDNRPISGAPPPPLVLRSIDAGRTWAPAARGLPDVAATAWAVDPTTSDALMIAGREVFLRTSDAGLTWQVARIEPGEHAALALAPANPRRVYLGGLPALRSTDRGDTWQPMPVVLPEQESQPAAVTGLVVDPVDPDHLWAGLVGGVAESTNGGVSWRAAGLDGKPVQWLAAGPTDGPRLYAGVAEDGIYRMDGASGNWSAAAKGLPERSTMLGLVVDPQHAGRLWATRDGGGVYRSTDGGASWANVALSLGDNLAQAVAIEVPAPGADGKPVEGGLLIGTANAGIWAFRAVLDVPPSAPPQAVDARIEVVWPHAGAPVAEAKLANIGLRLFAKGSLTQPPCGWASRVMVWQAANTNPAEPLGEASQRSVDGRLFPYWELNDVDVSRVRNAETQLYFMVRSAGPTTATSIWAHGADARTYFPQQDVPSGIAALPIDAVDARIQIVWPHDGSGTAKAPQEASLANIAIMLFKHGTRLSVPVGWQPAGLTLYGAWNHEVGRLLSKEPLPQTRTSGAVTYPVWEFTNIPVARALDPANRLYLWVQADGIETYPNIWAHGIDARTAFPVPDEPIEGCVP